MARLRVCQLITELRPGGAERCVYELARRLDRRRFQVHVAALRGGAVADWLIRAGVPVTVLGVRSRLDVRRLGGLLRLLREQRIDLLHTHLFHADLAGRVAAWLAGTRRLVHTVHVAEGRWRPWQYAWARLAAGGCDRIVCVSRAVRQHHRSRIRLPAWRYEVIPNGIDPAACGPNPEARQRLRRQWSIGPKAPVIVSVGRLDYQKNTPLLLAGAGELLGRRQDAHFVIVGDGPDAPAVERFVADARAHGRARWLGFRQDVPDVLAAADVFVQVSRWEGLPLTVVEAMATGLPVVASDVAGTGEVVADGETGILFAGGDAGGLVEAVERLLADPASAKRLGQAGRRRAEEHFSIAANVAAHERLYEAVAGEADG